MLQQTTVAAVIPYFDKFTARWPNFAALAAADDADVMAAWAGLGYYARARNLLKCARAVVAEHKGELPDGDVALLNLPGIGSYTAAAIATIAFGRRAVVVDANVERVVARLRAIDTPILAAKRQIRAATDAITPDNRAGDFAQAIMDLGRTICTPRRPKCDLCPLASDCTARQQGQQEDFPRKQAKAARPQREGFAYWLEHDDHVLLVRRPARGLLGGMLALPTGAWSERAQRGDGAPLEAQWRDTGAVDHAFTHFSLRLRLLRAEARDRSAGEIWWPIENLEEAGLPTVFAKAAIRAREATLPLLDEAA